MNAAARIAPAVSVRAKTIHGWHPEPCDCNGWSTLFGYHIEQYGRRGHAFSRGDGMERDEGIPSVVSVVSAQLVGPNKVPGVDLPLHMFTGDRLAEVCQVIADRLDGDEQ